MRRALWNGLAACVAIAALVASPAARASTKKTPTPASSGTSTASTASKAPKSDKAEKTEKVNLNTADEKTIAGAKGVGDKLAKELVKNRPYKTWEEVSKVKGVGSGKKLESLKTVLKLSEGVGAAAAKEEPAAEKKATKASAPAEPSSPSKKSSPSSTSSASSPKLAPGTKININTATKEELDALPEIGPVKAQAIVDYRSAHGKFAAPEDIMKVSGIKEGTYAKIKDYIVVR
jgi:competence protein ComEA